MGLGWEQGEGAVSQAAWKGRESKPSGQCKPQGKHSFVGVRSELGGLGNGVGVVKIAQEDCKGTEQPVKGGLAVEGQ